MEPTLRDYEYQLRSWRHDLILAVAASSTSPLEDLDDITQKVVIIAQGVRKALKDYNAALEREKE